MKLARACALGVTLAAAACSPRPAVYRAYSGNVVRGRFVEAGAYAAFLRGAIAEAEGRDRDALVAYGEADELDPGSPEIDTRIGEVRCRLNPRDATAQSRFAHALSLDPRYAPAWQANVNCAVARGDKGSRSRE
jgi:tetratricopeptide (TPR) repeat protein